MILRIPGFSDDIFTHLLAGLAAGFFAVCVGSPVDVVYFSVLLVFRLIDVVFTVKYGLIVSKIFLNYFIIHNFC